MNKEMNKELKPLHPIISHIEQENQQIAQFGELAVNYQKVIEMYQAGLFSDEDYKLLSYLCTRGQAIYAILQTLRKNSLEPDSENTTEEIESDIQVGAASGVAIYNPDDSLEVEIKNNIAISQEFKSMKKLFDAVNISNHGIKINSGRQKKNATQILSQYILPEPTGRTKYSIKVSDIFEIPHYIELDKHGGNRFYREKCIPLLLDYIIKIVGNIPEHIIYTTISDIARQTGIVNQNYGLTEKNKEITDNNPKLTSYMISNFYFETRPILKSVLFGVLDELQDERSVLRYKQNYCIQTKTGYRTSNDKEDEIITKAQRKIMKEFNVKRISTVFKRKLQNKFYKRVIEYINKEYGFDWISYRNQIQINVFDIDGITELLEDLNITNTTLQQYRSEINQRLCSRAEKQIFANFDRTNRRAEKIIAEHEGQVTNTDTYTALKNDGYSDMEAICVTELYDDIPRPKPYRVHRNCYDYQSQLIEILLRR